MNRGRVDVRSGLPSGLAARLADGLVGGLAGECARGLDTLLAAVLACRPVLAVETGPDLLLSESVVGAAGQGRRAGHGSADLPASDAGDQAERARLIALVDLARAGDREAFGLLYDHYHASVFRFVYYRTRSTTLAEDLTADTFFRALRRMNGFRWQGKDFGAWLMTIARNLVADHYKSGRTRLEHTTDDMGAHDDATEGPEQSVLTTLSHEALLLALSKLPGEQQDCLVMRFLEGFTIAETAAVLERSEGAVKQLQLRGVRNLAKLLPEGVGE